MSEHLADVVAYVSGEDESELGKTKAELAYALHCLERELAISAMSMTWERAEDAAIDPSCHYIVQHNGHEWRDFDLMIMPGLMVQRRLEPSYVRGRPEWVAKIIRPVVVGGARE